MKHGEWRNTIPDKFRQAWSGPDVQRAWAAHILPRVGNTWVRTDGTPKEWLPHGNDYIVVMTLRQTFREDFDQLSKLTAEELEALRAIAERDSLMWALLTMTLTYVEHGRPDLGEKP